MSLVIFKLTSLYTDQYSQTAAYEYLHNAMIYVEYRTIH